MSEKHLTELPWKTLATKEGVKDIGLGKALAAYANLDATKEPAKALEALKEISELALKLKKLNSAKAGVVDHLDEVIKEVKKTTPGLETRIKSAAAAEAAAAKQPAAAKPAEADPDEEKEAAEFKKDLKQQMVGALAQVKLRAPADPGQEKEPKPQLQFMAYLAGKTAAVIVARKVGSATKKLLPEIVGGLTGGKFFLGECIFEKSAHTFVLESVPGGLAKKLAAALTTETGQKYKVRVRSLDGSMVLDSDTDLDPGVAAPTTPVPDKTTATPSPPVPAKSSPKLSTYINATRDWKAAKATAANGVFALKTAIFKECDPELKDPLKAKIDTLNSILTVMDDAIVSKIEDAGREADEERQTERNHELARFAHNVLAAVRKHPLAPVADSNPFGNFTICNPVEAVLNKFITDFQA